MTKNKTHITKVVFEEKLCKIKNQLEHEIDVIIITITEVFTKRIRSDYSCNVDDGKINTKQTLDRLAKEFLTFFVLNINRISPNKRLRFCINC